MTKSKTILYEVYHFIWCLNRLQKKYELSLGFHADFIKAQFLPYIYNKLSRWDGDIKEAVKLWCSDPAAAEEKYGHISKWDVSHVTNMDGLFRDCFSFNDDISGWDVSNVTTMKEMFSDARAFNQYIGDWDVSNVTTMEEMFHYANVFNQNIGNWNLSKFTTMKAMFNGARAFNHTIGGWNVSTGHYYGRNFLVCLCIQPKYCWLECDLLILNNYFSKCLSHFR